MYKSLKKKTENNQMELLVSVMKFSLVGTKILLMLALQREISVVYFSEIETKKMSKKEK